MSISKTEFLKIMNTVADVGLAESWDNCGMQIDLDNDKYERILVSLELTEAVVKEAVDINADMIVTHHPLFFNNIKNITTDNAMGRCIDKLIKHNISVYSSHTCFDVAENGNNTYLAALLELNDVENFSNYGKEYIGVMGTLKASVDLKTMLEKLSKVLDIQTGEIRYTGDINSEIRKVGICTGAGADMAEFAQKCGCHVFITGDVRYHDAVWAMENKFALIDGGHFGTEKFFIENMAAQLKALVKGNAEILLSEKNKNPFKLI